MTQCTALIAGASDSIAAALRAVDCLSAETTASAFNRLFGAEGALMPALTLLLTLYIVFFALALLSGRSSIGIGALTPRMLTLGLVLTFATSWVAYQGVIWNLATGGPDQIAGILLGARGSATQIFADRIDLIFNAIAEVAGASTPGAPQQGAQGAQGSFTPTNLTWLASILLMLGTVGILVTARIALAVLLSLGPVFVTMLLFGGTRGLFAGWLRGVVLTAIIPLFAILGGSFMVELIVPVVAGLRGAEGVDGRAAMALFVMASVHCALMMMAIRVAGTMVAGWKVFGLAADAQAASPSDRAMSGSTSVQPAYAASAPMVMVDRARSIGGVSVRSSADGFQQGVAAGSGTAAERPLPRITVIAPAGNVAGHTPLSLRPKGIGSRFASRPNAPKELLK